MAKFKIGDKVRWNQSNENVAYTVKKIHMTETQGVEFQSISFVDFDNEWYSAENFDLITEGYDGKVQNW